MTLKQIGRMKKRLAITTFLFFCWTSIHAQNLKFGKPTDEEMSMTVYEQDKEAEAVMVLPAEL